MLHLLKTRSSKSLSRSYSTPAIHVQSGLSLTPAEMLDLSQRGIPVSSHMDDSMFYDGDASRDVVIDPLMCRGVDVVDAWNLQHRSRNNLVKSHLNDIQNYG